MEFTGERVVPWSEGMKDWAWVLDHHLHRYLWALGYCVDKYVTDLGCGAGYGTFILSFLAKDTIGIDISHEAVNFANEHFRALNLVYGYSPAEHNPNGADVYTCFEVLEHVDDPTPIVEQARKWKLGDAIFLGSIPVSDPGRFHKRVYTAEEIKTLVESWGHAEFFIQTADGYIYPEGMASLSDAKYVLFKLDL